MYVSVRKFTILFEKETSLQFNLKFNDTDYALLNIHQGKYYVKPLNKVFIFFQFLSLLQYIISRFVLDTVQQLNVYQIFQLWCYEVLNKWYIELVNQRIITDLISLPLLLYIYIIQPFMHKSYLVNIQVNFTQ